MEAEREEQLRALRTEIEELTYAVSHDLRAPLRAIDGFSRAVLEDWGDRLDAQGQDYLRRILAAAQLLGAQIDGLLQLSRAGTAELHPGRVDLTDLAQAVVEGLRRREPARRVEVEIAAGLAGWGDRAALRTVLEQLLDNAWKVTGTCQAPRIEVSADLDAGGFYVRDNGVGFNREQAAKLFRPFQRLHTDPELSGLGIGLALVRRIVGRHGGRVWAEGEPGRGAAFWFTLPLNTEAGAPP